MNRSRFRSQLAVALVVVGAAAGATHFSRQDEARSLAAAQVREAAPVRLGPSGLQLPEGKATPASDAAGVPVVSWAVANGVSRPLRDLPLAIVNPRIMEAEEGEGLRGPQAQPVPANFEDPVRQSVNAADAAPGPVKSFDGMNFGNTGCNCIPPDTNGAVGRTQYVQMANSGIAVYDKQTGEELMAPRRIFELFEALPDDARCNIDNDGDPVVLYDQLADRWLISQFAVPGGDDGYHECIGISKTSDATGEYYLYDFLVGDASNFHDYPHLGVWPDGYYMATHVFNPSSFKASGAFAFERDKMLNGEPARFVYFELPGVFGHLPADLDGFELPPAGAPNYFAAVDGGQDIAGDASGELKIWEFHVDWATPARSTFGVRLQPNAALPVADFVRPVCTLQSFAGCVPQAASFHQLESIGDRLMFRLAYRNFGDHESLVMNHTVLADSVAGQHAPRWYEVRDPGGEPVIYQQGTMAPADAAVPLHRWMGSIAQDRFGNIALAYSTSSQASFPSIAYAARLADAPTGELNLGETQLQAGSGSQNSVGFLTPRLGRWGDYSSLTVDPVDDCTFWYTTEYYSSPADLYDWNTRIVSFRLPGCETGEAAADARAVAASSTITAPTGQVGGALGATLLVPLFGLALLRRRRNVR